MEIITIFGCFLTKKFTPVITLNDVMLCRLWAGKWLNKKKSCRYPVFVKGGHNDANIQLFVKRMNKFLHTDLCSC